MAFDLTELLTFAKQSGASDVHISAGVAPMLRIRGTMTPVEMPPMSSDDARGVLFDMLNDSQKKMFEERRDLDFAFEIPGVSRFRGNLFIQQRGPGAVFRLIPNKILSLADLGMPNVLKDLANKERGLVVVTGPTGSGKSTTLAAMVDHINESRHGHILTIEDPIEFVHQSKNCLVNQREVGPHTDSFINALRGALREDPDVILVGELRDLETTALAMSAAETGHLVLATLHTNSASKTVDRIIDVFPANQQAQVRTMLSESLEGVVAQSLLPSKDGTGRVAALEVLVGVPALRNMIREDKTSQILSVIQTGAQHGMQSLDQSLRDLVMQGRLAREEAMRKSANPKLFEGSQGGSVATPGAGAAAVSGASAGPTPSRSANPPVPEPAKKPGLFGR
ncbi:MAG: type IV pilus twitching motility protein PilT [Candidatus Eisenbacteria bacterium]